MKAIGIVLVAFMGAWGCNKANIGIHDDDPNSSASDVEVASPPEPLKLDVLWVVDNSASAGRIQRWLVKNLSVFLAELPPETLAGLRMEVTTTYAILGGGSFMVPPPPEKFAVSSMVARAFPCLTSDDCAEEFGGVWLCAPPPMVGGELLLQNLNGSYQSSCIAGCEIDEECQERFCEPTQDEECTLDCVGSPSSGYCIGQPYKCEADGEPSDWIEWAPCHLQVGTEHSFNATIESGLRAAWMALDPEGEQATQAAAFLRPDAALLIVFISDEDDCSIDEDYSSPSYDCEHDSDCPGYTRCEGGLCAGIIKVDYFDICSLLGDYLGQEHHACSYDENCTSCEDDEDCEEGWYCWKPLPEDCREGRFCVSEGKCRPSAYEFNSYATFQNPFGTPIHALAPVEKFYDRFQSLKEDPDQVIVVAISGDAIVHGTDEDSFISAECLQLDKLGLCQAYKETRASATDECRADPYAVGCETLLDAKLQCARQCFIASKGDITNPQSKNSYVCNCPLGTAELGRRYIRLTEMFGSNGLALNLCAADDFGPLMKQLGEFVAEKME